jgi:hypothetical protein
LDENYCLKGVNSGWHSTQYGDIVPDTFANNTLLDYLTPNTPLFYNDLGGNYSGPARIDRMMLYMRDEAEVFDNDTAMDIDIIGFSRGAAQARDFSNRIVAISSKDKDGNYWYAYKDKNGQNGCQKVNFRFMGLWDTVLSTNFSGTRYTMGIPSQFAYVAQAVALNEHRSGNILGYPQRAAFPYDQHWGAFPLESIGASSDSNGKVRIEMGFLGAHADIGGGYGNNDLSKVALAWMLGQAEAAGVALKDPDVDVPSSAVLHDKSNNIQTGQPVESCLLCTNGEDRAVRGAPNGTTQRTMGFGNTASMTYLDTQQNGLITYRDRQSLPVYSLRDVQADGLGLTDVGRIKTDETGTVDINAYTAWLKLHGYSLDHLKVQ